MKIFIIFPFFETFPYSSLTKFNVPLMLNKNSVWSMMVNFMKYVRNHCVLPPQNWIENCCIICSVRISWQSILFSFNLHPIVGMHGLGTRPGWRWLEFNSHQSLEGFQQEHQKRQRNQQFGQLRQSGRLSLWTPVSSGWEEAAWLKRWQLGESQ